MTGPCPRFPLLRADEQVDRRGCIMVTFYRVGCGPRKDGPDNSASGQGVPDPRVHTRDSSVCTKNNQ